MDSLQFGVIEARRTSASHISNVCNKSCITLSVMSCIVLKETKVLKEII